MNINSFNNLFNIVAVLSGLVTIIKFFIDIYSSCHKNTSKDILPSVRIYAIVKQLNAPQMIYVHNHDSSDKNKKTFNNTIDNIIILLCMVCSGFSNIKIVYICLLLVQFYLFPFFSFIE